MSQQVPGSPLLPVERRLQETRSLESSTHDDRAAGSRERNRRSALPPLSHRVTARTAKAGFTRIPGEEFADLTEQRWSSLERRGGRRREKLATKR